MRAWHPVPLPAVRCLVAVTCGLVVGLHVFGMWPTWGLHLNEPPRVR
jgi:hypothetical protein